MSERHYGIAGLTRKIIYQKRGGGRCLLHVDSGAGYQAKEDDQDNKNIKRRKNSGDPALIKPGNRDMLDEQYFRHQKSGEHEKQIDPKLAQVDSRDREEMANQQHPNCYPSPTIEIRNLFFVTARTHLICRCLNHCSIIIKTQTIVP